MSENLPAPQGGPDEQAGHYNGQTIQGTIVPDASSIIPGGDVKAHAFFGVIRDLLHGSNLYHSEALLDGALEAVTAFEKHVLQGSPHAVIQETDRAPREDVTKRAAPQAGTAVVPMASSGAGLDYNKLAAAIVALQAQQRADEKGQTE